MRHLCAALLAAAGLLLGGPASAQTPPYVYAPTVGTSPVLVLAQETTPQRKRLIFVNPNATAKIAVCPIGPTRNTGAALVCAVNGAGSITILPYGSATIDGEAAQDRLAMPSGWNAVADTAGSALTIIEHY